MALRYSGPVTIDVQPMPVHRYRCTIACPGDVQFVMWVGASQDDIHYGREQSVETYDRVAHAALSFGSDIPSLREDYSEEEAECYADAVNTHAWPARDGSGWHVTRKPEAVRPGAAAVGDE